VSWESIIEAIYLTTQWTVLSRRNEEREVLRRSLVGGTLVELRLRARHIAVGDV
jgi:hypothetical protein